MPSPFPGMDPFIEASGHWQDFHASLLFIAREQILATLPDRYDAGIEERVQLFDQGDLGTQTFRPDVSIRKATGAPSLGGIAILADLEPVVLESPKFDTDSVGFIEIRTLPGSELVTVIEILSPTNKVEPDRSSYLAKMEKFREAGVNLVEIDLLLDGKRLPTREALPAGDYFTFVRRKANYPKAEVYAWSLRRKLPKIPIPLKPADGDVTLDLHLAFKETFERGGYARRVRYDVPLPKNLSEADRDWAVSTAASPQR